MKSETANVVAPVPVIWQRIQVCVFRHRVMEGSIKNGHLGNFRPEYLLRCPDALDVAGIMKWRKIDTVFNAAQHFIGDDRGFGKQFPTMDHAVSDSINLGGSLDLGYA